MGGTPNPLDTQDYSSEGIPAEGPNFVDTGLSRIAVASVPTKEEPVPEEVSGGNLSEEAINEEISLPEEKVPEELIGGLEEEEVPEAEKVEEDPLRDEVDVETLIDPINLPNLENLETELLPEQENESSEKSEDSSEGTAFEKQGNRFPWLDQMEKDKKFEVIKEGLLKELSADQKIITLSQEQRRDLNSAMIEIFKNIEPSFLENFYEARKAVLEVLILGDGDIESVAQKELVSSNLLRMNIYEATFEDSSKYSDIGMRDAMCLAASAYESNKMLQEMGEKKIAEPLISNFSKSKYLEPLLLNGSLSQEQRKSLINEFEIEESVLDEILKVFFKNAKEMHLTKE